MDNKRRLRMLDTAASVLLDDLQRVMGWTQYEALPHVTRQDVENANNGEGIDQYALLCEFDDALLVFAQARNDYAEDLGLDIGELTVEVGETTFACHCAPAEGQES